MALRFGCLLVLVPLLAACGGKSSTAGGNENQGGSSSAGTTSGGSASGGSNAQAGSTANGGSGGAANECTRYDDESPIPVDVTIINQTSLTIFLGQQTATCGGNTPLFSVATAAGEPLPSVGDCRASCTGARAGIGGCPAICAYPNTIQLEPGESHVATWYSLYSVDASLPERCLTYEGAAGDAKCTQAKRIAAGDYTFSAVAGLKVDCTMTSPMPECGACTPDPNGGCSIAGGLLAAQKLNASTAVTFDASYGFSDPAAGPSPGAGDAAPGALPTAHVEIIFKE